MEDIIDCDFKSFSLVLFVVKWYRLRLNQRDPDRTVIEHANGFTMVNTRALEPRTSEPYVLPSQCEHVFYSEVPNRVGWSFVIRHELRGRPVKYNVDEDQDSIEEDDDVDDQDELNDHLLEEDNEELLEPYDDVGDNVHEYDISDNDFFETDIDDVDDDMAINPYNLESGSDDSTDVDSLDGEDDHESQ